MATKLVNTRDTLKWFNEVIAIKEDLIKMMDKNKGTTEGFPDSSIGGSIALKFSEELQGKKMGCHLGIGKITMPKNNKDLLELLNIVLKQNPAPFYTAPFTNIAVYKALAIAGFVPCLS